MDRLDRRIYEIASLYNKKEGYTYIMPSPNPGKRLLIHGWIDPSKAAYITEEIMLGRANPWDFEGVEEIEMGVLS